MKEGWVERQLGKECEIIMGQSPPGTSYNTDGDGVPLINGPVEFGGLDPFSKTVPTKFTTAPTKMCKAGDLILCVRGSTTGRMNIAGQDSCIGRGVAAIRSRNNQDWVNQFISLSRDMIFSMGSGSTFPNVSASDLKKIAVPIPPLPEQRRIVAILNEAFDGISKALANAEKNLANARELFDSYLNNVFTRKGMGWDEKPLGEICENLDSKRIPITKSKRKSGNVPYYGASGIVDYVSEYIFDEDLLLVSEDGANLLARTYPIAFSISGKSWVNNHAHVLRFQDMRSQRFIEYYLNSISLEPFVSGMAQPKLNQKQLNGIPVPYPALTKQGEIAEQFGALSEQTKHLESIYQQKLTALAELKQSILQKAFSGELTGGLIDQKMEG